jgi:drug/metabolite transporter (DMT)-like permease
MPFIWVDLIATDFILLFTSSLVNIVGHLLIIRAFKHADASLLAPFVYFEIIMQTVLGLMLFGDFPDMWTWIGIALMVGVGVYISVKESGVQSK